GRRQRARVQDHQDEPRGEESGPESARHRRAGQQARRRGLQASCLIFDYDSWRSFEPEARQQRPELVPGTQYPVKPNAARLGGIFMFSPYECHPEECSDEGSQSTALLSKSWSFSTISQILGFLARSGGREICFQSPTTNHWFIRRLIVTSLRESNELSVRL